MLYYYVTLIATDMYIYHNKVLFSKKVKSFFHNLLIKIVVIDCLFDQSLNDLCYINAANAVMQVIISSVNIIFHLLPACGSHNMAWNTYSMIINMKQYGYSDFNCAAVFTFIYNKITKLQ